MIPSSTAIEVRGLSKRIRKTTVLEPVDLVVPRGAIYALVGHNGAGKTTLIKILLNILQPTAGEATILGLASTRLRGEAFKRIGYVSENQEMPEWMTVQQLMRHLFVVSPMGGCRVAQRPATAHRAHDQASLTRDEDEGCAGKRAGV